MAEGTVDDFFAWLDVQIQNDTTLARNAALDTALRGVSRAVRATNAAGKVDREQFKASWKARRTPDGAEVVNDAPYASSIEYGRRPGRPGPPLPPIIDWVRRAVKAGKLTVDGEGLGPQVALAIAIRNKIHFRGTKPTFILRKVAATLGDDFVQATARQLRRKHGGK